MRTTVLTHCSSVGSVPSSTEQTTSRTLGIAIIKNFAVIPSIFQPNLIFFVLHVQAAFSATYGTSKIEL
jgi:hypothetical protein